MNNAGLPENVAPGQAYLISGAVAARIMALLGGIESPDGSVDVEYLADRIQLRARLAPSEIEDSVDDTPVDLAPELRARGGQLSVRAKKVYIDIESGKFVLKAGDYGAWNTIDNDCCPAPCSCPCPVEEWNGSWPCHGLLQTYQVAFTIRYRYWGTSSDCPEGTEPDVDCTVNVSATLTADGSNVCQWNSGGSYLEYPCGGTTLALMAGVRLDTTDCEWDPWVSVFADTIAVPSKGVGQDPIGEYAEASACLPDPPSGSKKIEISGFTIT